jgi:hypothetical protein
MKQALDYRPLERQTMQLRLKAIVALLVSLVLVPVTLATAAASGRDGLPTPAAVPGGFALVPLAASGDTTPTARYNGRRVLVLPHDGGYVAVVGIPLKASPGRQSITVSGAARKRYDFEVTAK